MLPIQSYINHFVEIWENSSHEFPTFRREFSTDEKFVRENNYEKFQKKIKEVQSRKNIQQFKNNPGQSIFPLFKGFLKMVFDFEEEQLKVILSEEFKNVSKDFFNKARSFGPELKPQNIYQGLRNVWIMNGVQLMMEAPVKITPSVFAYSMIYPYSDNLLDDPTISTEDKQEFSKRFNRRLHGETIQSQSFTEEQLFKLVTFFEDEFPRNKFPKVYDSLYAIQKGQTNSLKLLQMNGLSKSEIQNICFEKGGASVLADGFLVAGNLSAKQQQALFGYGVYLQLLDDIQDVKEDSLAHTKTMFSYLEKQSLGEFVNQTIYFGRTVLEEMKCFPGVADGVFLELMKRSIETMIIEAVGLNNTLYTEDYLAELEKFSPLHFEFIREKRTQLKSQRFAIFQKFFEKSKPVNIG
jgi:hypothetical protein